MAFILGVICKISDTRGPIWMKFLGCIEFTLKPCTVVFSTSGLDLKTGNWNFPENPTIIPCNVFLDISEFGKSEILEYRQLKGARHTIKVSRTS